ncbi:MAG: KTSC domain-containing protein [Xanthobacteraceae bacterium]
MPSTAIHDFSYEAASHRLTITFVSGRRYVYDDVPSDVFDAFTRADSRGGFFNRDIRDRYRYREVGRRE